MKNLKTKTIFFAFLTCFLLNIAYSETQKGPLKVYILVGQSNMQGHAKVTTFDHIGMDPKTAPLLKEMRNSDGSPVVCDNVWISSLGTGKTEKKSKLTVGYGAENAGPKIGPEFTFGIYMQKLVKEPILIIKTSWGGKSLNTDFRPPSAGAYKISDAQKKNFEKKGKDLKKVIADKKEATGHYYRLMLEHVRKVLANPKRVYPNYDKKHGFELAGMVWFQGWNDLVDSNTYPDRKSNPKAYQQYTDLLRLFIKDVRKDLKAPKLPFIIGVLGVGGNSTDKSSKTFFQGAMAAAANLPEFKGNVKAVKTGDFWDHKLGELDKRWGKVKNKSRSLKKDKKLSKKEREKALLEFTSNTFSSEELKLKKMGISNGGYHYLGSAKIMAQIGKAFAEALDSLSK